MRTKSFDKALVKISDVSDPHRLHSRQIVADYQPGNGSRYVLHLAQLPGGVLDPSGGLWSVALIDGALAGRCCVLSSVGHLHPGYLAEKMNLSVERNRDDLMVLTEIVGHLIGRPTVSALEEE